MVWANGFKNIIRPVLNSFFPSAGGTESREVDRLLLKNYFSATLHFIFLKTDQKYCSPRIIRNADSIPGYSLAPVNYKVNSFWGMIRLAGSADPFP